MRHFIGCLLAALILVCHPGHAAAQTSPSEAPPASQPPGYDVLADLLEDDVARAALVAELRRLAGEVAGPAELAPEDVSIARQIARITHSLAETIVVEIAGAYDRVRGLGRVGVSTEGIVDLAQAALDLGAVVVGVVAMLWLARWLASAAYRRASGWVLREDGPRLWLKRGVAAIGCSLLDLAIVALGWVVGYAIALFVLGEGGRMDTRQSLFLNAFLVIESAKVVLRLFFATRYDGLRLLPIRGEDAAYWNTWLSRMTSFIGYGVLLVVPIVGFNLGVAAGNLASALIYAVALVFAIIVIRQNRVPVRNRLKMLAARSQFGFARMLLGTLARVWHVVMIVYACVLALLLLVNPETALTFIVAATVQTVVAIAAGAFLSMLIDKAIAFGIELKPEMRGQFPMLEERLNAFVPTTLKAVRVVIAIVVAALVLDAWSVFDFFGWLSSERGIRVVGTLMTVALIVAVTFAVWLVVSSWIEYRLNLGADGRTQASSARERTLLTIFRNAFTIALVVMAVMISLSEMGLDIGPLLAGAGVLGLAIGFGAQKLVQDVITGVFIQLENAIYTGDVVTAGGTTGVVEKLTVRSVGIRDLSGTYHLIPFSSVDTVSNFMRGFGYHVGEYGVAYRENVDEVIEVLKQAFEELRADPAQAVHIIGELEVHGITEFADSAVTVRVRIKTQPGQQWALGRAFNGIVKKRFDAAGIEIPFPHVTLYFGEDKKGNAPSAPVRIIGPAVDDEAAEPSAEASGTAPAGRPRRRRKAARATMEPDIPSEDEV